MKEEEAEFHGFTEETKERTGEKQQLRIEEEEDELDMNGNTFGMVNHTKVNFFHFNEEFSKEEEIKNETQNKELFQVKMSRSLVSHLKSVLGQPLDELLIPDDDID